MKNLKASLAIVFFLFSGFLSGLFAQTNIDNLSISYGPSLPDGKEVLVKIAGEANGKIYGLAMQKSDYFVQIFDSASMKRLSSNKIELPEMDDKELHFEEMFLLGGKLFVIGSVYASKEKAFKLVARQVSDKGILDKKPIILFEAEVAKRSEKGQFYFRDSDNNDMLLIMHTSKFPKEDAVKYEVKLFDDKLAMAFRHEEKVAFDDRKKDYEFSICDFDMTPDRDIYMVINESYRDSKAKDQVERFEIHAFKKAGAYKKEIIQIKLKDKEIINCSIMGRGSKAKLVGFYSGVRPNGKALKELRGIFHITVDLDNKVSKEMKFNEFTMKTKALILGDRRAEKGKELKPLYYITDLIEKTDGSLLVLSEYQTVYAGKAAGIGPLQMTPVTYTRNEIIITALKPDGSLSWSNVLPKEQVSTFSTLSFSISAFASAGSGGGTFTVTAYASIPLTSLGHGPEYLGAIPMYMDGHLYMIFNDNEKNMGVTDMDEIKAFTNPKTCMPTMFVYDDAGTVVRKDPKDEIKQGLVLRPGVYWRKSDTELICYSSRAKQEKLGRVYLMPPKGPKPAASSK